jgi:hypothetical protein
VPLSRPIDLNRDTSGEAAMADTLKLTAEDGHEFAAYLAQPEGRPKGGVVVIQEIFGVNSHMRSSTSLPRRTP